MCVLWIDDFEKDANQSFNNLESRPRECQCKIVQPSVKTNSGIWPPFKHRVTYSRSFGRACNFALNFFIGSQWHDFQSAATSFAWRCRSNFAPAHAYFGSVVLS